MTSSDRPPDCSQSDFMEKVFATNRDLDEAYLFLIPTIGGAKLEPNTERNARKALARLLRNDDVLLDRGLRHMLAAVFDSERIGHADGNGGYAWVAGERVATLQFRSKTRRKSPLQDLFIGAAIERERADKKISVEEATRNIAEALEIDYETAKKARQKALKVIQMGWEARQKGNL